MPEFNGISETIFKSCERSEKIRIPINLLKDLQAVIEPELRKINPQIKGHVSRIKERGTNIFRNWAWLYFNTQTRDAWKYSQLSVNISPNRLYVGVDIRTSDEYRAYRKELLKPENCHQIENLLQVLSLRDLFFSDQNDDWEKTIARQHSVEELRGDLLAPKLFWINIPFEKNDPILRQKSIAKEIIQIFTELYNVYAYASGNKTISQNPPKHAMFIPHVEAEIVDSPIESDATEAAKIMDFLNSLKEITDSGNHHLPGRNDQYVVKRKALEYNLKPITLDIKGVPTIIYSDQNITLTKDQILEDYEIFVQQLNRINSLFPLPKNFMKIMFVNTTTDARYYKTTDGGAIFVNLAAFHMRRDFFFWLFTISRELAYIKTHQIGYPFFKEMRRLMVHSLNNLSPS